MALVAYCVVQKNLHGIWIEKSITFDINFNECPISKLLIEKPNDYNFIDEDKALSNKLDVPLVAP